MKQIVALALVLGISGMVVPSGEAAPAKVATKNVVAHKKHARVKAAVKANKEKHKFNEVEAGKGAERGGGKTGQKPGGPWLDPGNNLRIE